MPHHPPTLIAGGRWNPHNWGPVGAHPVSGPPGVISTRRWAPCLLQEFAAHPVWRIFSGGSGHPTLVSWHDTGPQSSPSSLACKGKVGPVTSNWPHFLIWLFFSDSVPMYRTRPIGEDLHFLSSLDFQCMISIDQQSLVSRPVVLTSADPSWTHQFIKNISILSC